MTDTITTTSIWSTPVLVLLAVAVGAMLYSCWSLLQAYNASSGHKPFDDLGFRKWVIGYVALNYMPERAMVHVKRHFVAFAVFFLSGIALVAVLWAGRS